MNLVIFNFELCVRLGLLWTDTDQYGIHLTTFNIALNTKFHQNSINSFGFGSWTDTNPFHYVSVLYTLEK